MRARACVCVTRLHSNSIIFTCNTCAIADNIIIVPPGDCVYSSSEAMATSSSGSSSPDHEISLESSRALAGSYTILTGEVTLDKLPVIKATRPAKPPPPQVPPKPSRSTGVAPA